MKIDKSEEVKMSNYLSPMQPWSSLEKYARKVDLPASGLKLFLYEAGSAESPVVLLLHGGGDDADTWRHLIEALASNCRVIAPDLPGFARSDKPQVDYSIHFLSEILLEFLETLAIPAATWIGHSLGAIISQTIALEHPERVDDLVLIDGTLLARAQKLNIHTLLFLVPGVGEWLYNRLRKDPQAAYDTLYPYYHDLDGLPQADRDFLFQRVNQRVWSDDQRQAYFSTLRNMVSYVTKSQKGLEDRLAQMKIPTLVVWGENDRLFPVENARALAEIQPTARLVILPQAGHNLQQECPQELIKAILGDDRLRIRAQANNE